nr:hypothetical protein [Mucilaginibacter sp. SP1R1]
MESSEINVNYKIADFGRPILGFKNLRQKELRF